MSETSEASFDRAWAYRLVGRDGQEILAIRLDDNHDALAWAQRELAERGLDEVTLDRHSGTEWVTVGRLGRAIESGL